MVRKKDKTKRNVIIGMVVVGALVLFLIYGDVSFLFTAVTNPGIPEPRTQKQCNFLGGICVPVEQPDGELLEFGSCSTQPPMKCMILDNCIQSGGRYFFKDKEIGNRIIFEKSCHCPNPLAYDLTKGCVRVFN